LRAVFRLRAERKRELAYSDLCQRLVHGGLARSLWLRPLGCSRLSPGVIATMSRSDFSLAPAPLVSPLGTGSGERYRRSAEPTRSPSVTHAAVPPIPTPTTSRIPVLGFAFPGQLARALRRIAFT